MSDQPPDVTCLIKFTDHYATPEINHSEPNDYGNMFQKPDLVPNTPFQDSHHTFNGKTPNNCIIPNANILHNSVLTSDTFPIDCFKRANDSNLFVNNCMYSTVQVYCSSENVNAGEDISIATHFENGINNTNYSDVIQNNNVHDTDPINLKNITLNNDVKTDSQSENALENVSGLNYQNEDTSSFYINSDADNACTNDFIQCTGDDTLLNDLKNNELHVEEIKISIINVCGLKSKLSCPELHEYISSYDIIGMAETKFKEIDVTFNDYHTIENIPGYSFYHKARKSRHGKVSGGIAIIIKNSIKEKVEIVETDNDYILWCKFKCLHLELYNCLGFYH